MSVRFSTGLRNNMLNTTGLKGSMDLGFLHIYTGVQPTSSDSPIQGIELLKVSVDGDGVTGLTLTVATLAVIQKALAENWKGNGITDGVAGWARFKSATDTNTDNTTDARIDMSVAQTGGDLNLSNTTVVTGAPTTVDIFQITMVES